MVLTIPAEEVQQLLDQVVEKFPAAQGLKGIKLSAEHADFTVNAPQLGDVAVRVIVEPGEGG